MKKVFLLKYLLLYSTLANNHQGPPTAKKISPPSPSPDTPDLPIFTWRNETSIHLTYPDQEEDTIHLHPSDTGGVNVKCLYDGRFSKEATASAVVSGCLGNSSIYITVYTSHLQGNVFTVTDNVTIEEVNPYASGGDYSESDYDYEEEQLMRLKRGTFEYYSGEEVEEYVDIPFDGPAPPMPSHLNLRYKLGYDESLKAHLGSDEAARDYVISVAAHASLHMRHATLATEIRMEMVGLPTFAAGKTLDITRRSLIQVQGMKTNEAVPLIVMCKTDDSSGTRMGMAWPGYKSGACHPTKGAALIKWRGNPALAAITFSHETGHLVGLLHDFDEDRRNGYYESGPCEGTGIMSDGSKYRPAQWSNCSSERLKKWYSNFGQCLQSLDDVDGPIGNALCNNQNNNPQPGSLSVKLVSGYPYLSTGAAWKPICGHYFWDNNNGASLFCKKLGYSLGGSVTKEKQAYAEDAYYVGRCGSGDIADFDTGCTKHRESAMLTSCQKGNNVSIKITCKGPTYVALNNGPGCGNAAISNSSDCGIAATFLGYSGKVQDVIDGNAPRGCVVGHAVDGWKYTYFNNHATGSAGSSLYRSVCHSGSLSVKLVSGYPYLSTAAVWRPICGHYFWNNNNGASLFCKKLGYSLGGSVTQERKAYAEDAYYVGQCGSGDITDFENGCTKHRESAMLTRCQKGNNVSIKITCKGPTYVALNNAPGCANAAISSSSECGIAATFLGYSGKVQDVTDGNVPPGCVVGHAVDGWKYTYFNRHATGSTSSNMYRSVCHSGVRYWSSAQDKIWGDDECPFIKSNHNSGLSLEECKKKCLDTPSCTAINYRAPQNCILRGCDYPVPAPQWTHGNYKGYSIQEHRGDIPLNPKCATACEKSGQRKLDLSCPETEKIGIKFAVYGRLEASTCPSSAVYSTTCSSSTTWSKVKELCEGKQACEVHASNANFGDPCVGTQKYLSVCYVCSDIIL